MARKKRVKESPASVPPVMPGHLMASNEDRDRWDLLFTKIRSTSAAEGDYCGNIMHFSDEIEPGTFCVYGGELPFPLHLGLGGLCREEETKA